MVVTVVFLIALLLLLLFLSGCGAGVTEGAVFLNK